MIRRQVNFKDTPSAGLSSLSVLQPTSTYLTPGAPRRGRLRGEPVRAPALRRGGQLRRREGPGVPVQLQG